MKAITINQPEAALIAAGIKNIELRTWNTSYRGVLYVHAGAHVPSQAEIDDYIEIAKDYGDKALRDFLRLAKITRRIICRVDLVAVVAPDKTKKTLGLISDSDRERIVFPFDWTWGENNDFAYKFVLQNAAEELGDVEIKGQLRIWNF